MNAMSPSSRAASGNVTRELGKHGGTVLGADEDEGAGGLPDAALVEAQDGEAERRKPGREKPELIARHAARSMSEDDRGERTRAGRQIQGEGEADVAVLECLRERGGGRGDAGALHVAAPGDQQPGGGDRGQ
jgi:hypothetical protein